MLLLIKIVINYFSLISFFAVSSFDFNLTVSKLFFFLYSSCKALQNLYFLLCDPFQMQSSCIFLVNAIKYKASYGIMQNLLPWFFSYFLLVPKNCKHGYVFIGLWKVSFLNSYFNKLLEYIE